MKLLAVVKNPVSIARYLTAAGEPIEAPGRSPGRGPPYWKSRVLRLQAQGDESDGRDQASKGERAAWPWATRQRNERKQKRGLHRGAAELARRQGLARWTPRGGRARTRLRAAGASRSRAKTRRGRADWLANRACFTYAPIAPLPIFQGSRAIPATART